MAEMLLINPRKRTRRTAAKRRTTAKRCRNPVTPLAAKAPARRRRNPIGLSRVHRRIRRRRNPIGGINTNRVMDTLKTALMGGAGAVAVDVLMGQIVPFLPASLLPNPSSGSTISVYDAVKAAVTIAAGEALAKPTKGMSRKLAQGALTVQSYQILHTFVPTGMSLGYMSPANIVQGTARLRPNMTRVAAYQTPGQTALLSGTAAYQAPGARSNLLSGARQREAVLR